MLRPSMHFVAALAVSVCSVTACSSSSDSPTTTTDSGSDSPHVDTAVPDTTPAPTDTTPAICWFVKSSQSVERACDDCSDTKCSAEHVACVGSAYLDAKFSGVCGSFADCMCGCKEADRICQQACTVSAPDACRTCLGTIDSCETKNCPKECTGA